MIEVTDYNSGFAMLLNPQYITAVIGLPAVVSTNPNDSCGDTVPTEDGQRSQVITYGNHSFIVRETVEEIKQQLDGMVGYG